MMHLKRFSISSILLVLVIAYGITPTVIQTVSGKDIGAATVAQAADNSGGDAGAAAAPKRKGSSLLRVVLIESGIWEWFLIILSVIALAFIIQIFVEQRPEKMIPPNIEEELGELFDNEEYEQALDVCEEEDCMVTRTVAAGLSRMNAGYDSMQDALEEVGEQEATLIFQKLGYISLIAAVAPMLGLLGTVVGMIKAFQKIVDTGGTADPGQLAGGISTALITTASGLLIAIPTTAAFMFFKNRAVRMIMDSNLIIHDLFDRFRAK